jgi:hypothetical protein
MGGTDECAARAHGCVPVRARDASVGDEPRDVVLGTLWADGVSICMATLEGRERDAVNEHARPSSRKHCCSIIRRGPAGPLRLPSTSPFARSVMVLRAALWTRPPLCVCVRFLWAFRQCRTLRPPDAVPHPTGLPRPFGRLQMRVEVGFASRPPPARGWQRLAGLPRKDQIR